MQFRTLGRTGISISTIAFGAGPVSGLMTGTNFDKQAAVVRRAIDRGINWFDTAAGYGQGASETNLGRALQTLTQEERSRVHIATKVRVSPDGFRDLTGEIRRSVEASLQRLQLKKVTLLQLHNGITRQRDDEPASVSPRDVLGSNAIADLMTALRDERLCDFIGLTGTGHPDALREVIRSGRFDTVQLPYHVLNPSAGQTMPPSFSETNYGNIIADCAHARMGVMAIRVFAAGALLQAAPSAHTKITPFFPLALYERDVKRAAFLTEKIQRPELKELAIRFALSHPSIHAAIVGLGAAQEVDEVVDLGERGVLNEEMLEQLQALLEHFT